MKSDIQKNLPILKVDGRIEITPNLAGVLVRVDLEVAEVATLAAEGDVHIQPERRVG